MTEPRERLAAPKVYALEAVRDVVESDREALVAAVRTALIAQSAGRTISPAPVHVAFDAPAGDCHVKAAAIRAESALSAFAVKIATTFYDNPKRGLPANGGAVIVLDTGTGQVSAVLLDEGWLTAWRTAAVGAVVARAMAPAEPGAIGVFGTGQQAFLQLDWLRLATGCRRALIHGRNPESAKRLVERAASLGFEASVASSPEAVLAEARLVVTATASREPLFPGKHIRPGTHVTAMGADMPGKQELDTSLFERAEVIAVDDLTQCLDHGDSGYAVRAGAINSNVLIPLGHILEGRRPVRNAGDEITIADLTGLGATDAAAATLVLSQLTQDAR